MQFQCATCGSVHDAGSISFGADRPDQWLRLSEDEKQTSILTADQCVINSGEDPHFFVRACLEIPIRGSRDLFTWGVWVSVSHESFDQMQEHWEDIDREQHGPYFGWLCTRLPIYPDTMFLKTMVHQRPPGIRPRIELEPTQHPLAVEQREGIEPPALQRLIASLLHE